jgi:hypothetical protein
MRPGGQRGDILVPGCQLRVPPMAWQCMPDDLSLPVVRPNSSHVCILRNTPLGALVGRNVSSDEAARVLLPSLTVQQFRVLVLRVQQQQDMSPWDNSGGLK